MWEAALVIDYFAHVLRAIILSLGKKKEKKKVDWRPQRSGTYNPYACYFTLVVSVSNVRENSIYTTFRQM